MDDKLKRRLENFESVHKSAGQVDLNKVNAYASGSQKKSKREREKEAAEAKRIQEEEDAAKAYKDFVASFEDANDTPIGSGNGRSGLKTFVRAGGSGSPNVRPPSGPSGFRPAGASSVPTGPRSSAVPGAPSGPKAMGTGSRAAFDNARASTSKQPSTPAAPASTSTSNPKSMFEDDDAAPAKPAPIAVSRKKRAMDSFLDELKRNEADREKRLQGQVLQGVATSVSAAAAQDLGPWSGGRGSYDTGDSGTTNLHVGNLPANVTANAIGMHFAQFGPVASVKIMWPREEGAASVAMTAQGLAARRAGLNGFISFMKRADAEACLEALDGQEWSGSVLRLGWGKAMPLPPRPSYVVDTPYRGRSRSRSPELKRKNRSRSRSRSRSPGHGRSRRRSDSRSDDDRGRSAHKRSRRSRSRSYSSDSRGRSRSGSQERRRRRSLSHSRPRSRSRSQSRDRRRRDYSRSRSRSPRGRRWPELANDEQRRLLEDVARRFKGQHGRRFEETLRDKERDNPKYDFLRDDKLQAYHYFKMLLNSRYRAPSPPPPAFEDEGDNDPLSSDDEELEREAAKKKQTKLGRLSRTKLEAMLRSLSNTREKIARVMVFALDRPDAAPEVAEVIIQSLLIASTPVPRKVARLNVISDILHNCAGAPTSAWQYRMLFETKLPEVFTHLGEVHKSFPGRMKAETFRKQIMTVIQVWEAWLVFTPSVLQDLEKRLSTGDESIPGQREHSGSAEVEAQQGKRTSGPSAPSTSTSGTSGFKAISGFSAVKAAPTEETSPATMEEDLDGEDIDVAEMPSQADNLDGDPMDGDDLDGAPL